MKNFKIIIFIIFSLSIVMSGCSSEKSLINSSSSQEKELLKTQIEVSNTENSTLNNTAEVFQKNYDNLPSGYSFDTLHAAKNLYNFFSDVKKQYSNTNLYTLIPSINTENYIDAMISSGEDGMEAMNQLINYCNTKSITHFNAFSNKITDSVDNLKLARQELNIIMETLKAGKPIGTNMLY
ncbi:MAG: hypothetical protein AB7V48_14195 [Sedimentibacter sp.]